MEFFSTRNHQCRVSGPEAIIKGIAPDGGLFVPEGFPQMSHLMEGKRSYNQISFEIINSFFPALVTQEEITKCYSSFVIEDRASLVRVKDKYVLELFHGPTAAFKDFALQLLPLLMEKSKKALGNPNRTLILTATSGDTGKAALQGFANVDGIDNGIDIAVLYPSEGVSWVQKQQMITQEGKNVAVYGIEGDFDDAQRAVKRGFLDQDLKEELAKANIELSSANSINIGRLIPQIAYYFYTYNQLLNKGEIQAGEKLSFVVPTGNFGDILAGYYGKQMGLPVDQLICASNENKVLKEFFETGIYDRKRVLIQTSSPSMDIVVSSNLERFLYHGIGDTKQVKEWMDSLDKHGVYQVNPLDLQQIVSQGIIGSYCKENQSFMHIKSIYEECGYLLDPHTAVAWGVSEKIQSTSKQVILATADPFKFTDTLCNVFGIQGKEGIEAIHSLGAYLSVQPPQSILSVMGKAVLHQEVIQTQDLSKKILERLQNGKVKIKVPATTANIGPGFDALGIALDLYGKFEFSYSGLSSQNTLEGMDVEFCGIDQEFCNKDNLIFQSFVYACKKIQPQLLPDKIVIQSNGSIPISRGLGSSAACIVAGILMAFEVSKKPYTREEILDIANEIEGHPDNVAPAIYGGFRASLQRQGKVHSQSLKVHQDLNFICAVPNFRLSTEEARRVLPKEVAYEDAIFNLQNLGILVGCFQNRDYDSLRVALEDRLHQPYRKSLIPGGEEIFEWAKESKGVYLSGAGPTIMILDDEIQQYDEIFKDKPWTLYFLKVDFGGAKVDRWIE